MSLLRRQLKQMRAEGELSLGETAAVALLDRLGPVTTAALARYEHVTPQSMGLIISRLEDRGLAARRPDPDDGRQVIHHVTTAGVERLRDVRTVWDEAVVRVLASDFTEEELHQLTTSMPLLERLAQRVR